MLLPTAGASGAWEVFRGIVVSSVGQPGVGGLVDQALAWDRFFLWLAPVAPSVALLSIRRDLAPPVKALWASALLTAVAYLFYPRNQGHGWGYRYLYPAIGVLPIAAGLSLAQPAASDWLRRLALACALGSLLVLVPLRLIQVQHFIDSHLAQIPGGPSAQTDVVFIRPTAGYFAGNLIQNDPFLEHRPLYLLGMGEEDERRFMSKTFPGARRVGGTKMGSVWQVSR
jgi:hypothetical protein